MKKTALTVFLNLILFLCFSQENQNQQATFQSEYYFDFESPDNDSTLPLFTYYEGDTIALNQYLNKHYHLPFLCTELGGYGIYVFRVDLNDSGEIKQIQNVRANQMCATAIEKALAGVLHPDLKICKKKSSLASFRLRMKVEITKKDKDLNKLKKVIKAKQAYFK